MKKIIFLIVFTNFQLNISKGQGFDLLPSTPESSSLGKYIDFPISLHTGTHNINIPIYELETASLKIPIGLTYHSSGIKLQEIASRSGMGWTLRAGGSIICAPGGTPDLGFKVVPESVRGDFQSGEYDMFYYSFGQYEGKFIIDENKTTHVKTIHKIDSNNLVINGNENAFSIRDDSGNEFIFTKTELITDKVDYMHPGIDDFDEPYWSSYTFSYTSAWYLTEIKLNNGESVSFKYSDQVQIIYDKQTTSTFLPYYLKRSGFEITWGTNRYRTVSTKLLTRINYRDQDIIFHYNLERQDLQGDKALTDIKVFSNNNVKHVKLDYSFKESYNCDESVSSYACKRMFLNRIYDASDPLDPLTLYKFYYNETAMPHRKSFNMDYWGYYNQTGNNVSSQLPVYIYPNSERHYEKYLPFQKPSFNAPEIVLTGRNPNVNQSLSQAGILTKIEYATSGTTEFEYESNEFLWFPEASTNISAAFNVKGGGLRIKKISHKDLMGNVIVKEFGYNLPDYPTKTSGGSVYIPLYAYPGLGNREGVTINTASDYKKVMIRSFYDLNVLGAQSGKPIGYRYVTVRTTGLGKTVYQYSFPGAYGDTHDDASRGCSIAFEGICDNLYEPHVVTFDQTNPIAFGTNLLGKDLISLQMNTFPFGPHINYDWNRGLLLKETGYDESGNLKIKKEYNYKLIYANKYRNDFIEMVLPALKDVYVGSGLPAAYKTASFKIMLGIAKVREGEKETIYTNGEISSSKKYTYDTHKLLIASEEILTSDGKTRKKVFKYPPNMTSSNQIYQRMTNRNMISYPVEESSYLNNILIDKKITTYSDSWFSDKSILAPIEIQTTKGTASPKTDLLYLAYDVKGRPLKLKLSNTRIRSFKYSDRSRPIAVIENALDNEVFYEDFENTGNVFNPLIAHTGKKYYSGNYNVTYSPPNTKEYMISYWYRDSNTWKYTKKPYTSGMILSNGLIDDIQIIPKDALMTSYAYDPLSGLTGVIDPSGKTSKYEYDRYNRLNIVKDNSGFIVQQTDYNYKTSILHSVGNYTNQLLSNIYTKNDCPTGFQGTQVVYTVEAGRYTGATQSEANAKAQADLNENGQDFANINGTCIDLCQGEGRKIINGICETGTKYYTRSVQMDFDTWYCYYKYRFSDGSTSQEYYEESITDCTQ